MMDETRAANTTPNFGTAFSWCDSGDVNFYSANTSHYGAHVQPNSN